MREIHCPDCHKLLLKANFAEIQIKCKCGRIVDIKSYSQEADIFSPHLKSKKEYTKPEKSKKDSKSPKINISEKLMEVIDD